MTDAKSSYTTQRRNHWGLVASSLSEDPGWNRLYHRRLAEIYQSLIPPGLSVLELGCGQGDLLASLNPSEGVGIDFSGEMIRAAKHKHPGLRFIESDVHDFEWPEKFDVIILSDLVNDVWDVQTVFQNMRGLCDSHTRIIINTYSRLWELPLAAVRRLKLAKPLLNQNWLTVEDINNLLQLSDLEMIRNWSEVLCPFQIPIVEPFCNKFLAKLWPFRHGALTNFVVARPAATNDARQDKPLVSVIVPARNEAGNIPEIFSRAPEMGRGTQLVFVEGHSTDDTYATIQREISANPHRNCKLLRQSGEGKGDAVRLGFDHADGDVLMILDADLTVRPEDLPRFCNALLSGKGDFINGVRLVYPMENHAMRFANQVGNKMFSLIFSWLLGQPIKDTLCGTKVLWKRDYKVTADNRSYFGTIDPFGDFDLILGAARLNLKIIDLPVRYGDRKYGDTNIRRWQHGLLLLRMAVRAAFKLKFV
ncbi:MAG: glycosyltransferase [Desulfomonile tiedjei]|uniref:Glycosyltransferase n=1 Tax=Desulfomonile tiedjei TaxID=2358 RepID=A0A9D6V5S5_9BACT|nr:glycosyltransferase [Desulfomonile tiedjei]